MVQDFVSQWWWVRWTKEYLTSQQPRSKWTTEEEDLTPGMVVFMLDRSTPRNRWPLAKITEVVPGADGKVQLVRLLHDGKQYVRPITGMALLEIGERLLPSTRGGVAAKA